MEGLGIEFEREWAAARLGLGADFILVYVKYHNMMDAT